MKNKLSYESWVSIYEDSYPDEQMMMELEYPEFCCQYFGWSKEQYDYFYANKIKKEDK